MAAASDCHCALIHVASVRETMTHSSRRSFRRLLYRVPLLPAAMGVISCVLAVLVHPWALFLAGGALLVTAYHRQWRELLLCLILCCLASGAALHQKKQYRHHLGSFQQTEGRPIDVEGSVIRCLANSVWITPEGQSVSFEVAVPEGTTPRLGEKWKFTGYARQVAPPRLSGAFDRAAWLERNNVIGRITASHAENTGEGNVWSRILARSENIRNRVSNILLEGSTPNDIPSNIMISLLLGEKRGLDPGAFRHFKDSGSLHIFAVSGLHVGIAALLLLGVFQLSGLSPSKARLLVLPLLALYVFVTGMPVSACRALVMVAVLFSAMAFRERNNSINTLSLAAIVFLLWNPRQLLDPDFQLSFAIFGAIVIVNMWGQERKPYWTPDPFIPKRIYSWTERLGVNCERKTRLLVTMSIFCWLAAIPLTAVNFGTFNLYSVVTNILMTPVIPPLMACCMLAVAFSWCGPALLLLNTVSRFLAGILLLLSQLVSSLPASLAPACLPAKEDAFMVIPHLNGSATVILGNPGLLINAGSPESIRFDTVPALWNSGFTPKAHLLTKPQKALLDGAPELEVEYPHVLSLGVASSLKLPHALPCGPNGGITIFAPGKSITYGIQDDHNPVIMWECNHKRLLYLGDASLHSAMQLPPEAMKADILIIGRHSKDPVDEAAWILETNASTVIFTAPPAEDLVDKLTPHTTVYNTCNIGALIMTLSAQPSISP